MRLKRAALAHLPPAVQRPAYDPDAVTTGIVHLGLGNFHRAHQAVYTDEVLQHDPRWGICGVSLKSRGVMDALSAQDGLYTVVAKHGNAEGSSAQARIIGSLREALCGADGMAQVIARMAAPATRIVSLTITEKGYCHDPASGRLNFTHPDIAHDLMHAAVPRSAMGAILQALHARKALAPRVCGRLTILSCDNLPHNGRTLEGLMHELADAVDPALSPWMRDHVTFPSTMVDRIVPATTAHDIADTGALIGMHDAAPVMTEPFSQWVIEDRFAAGRPAWERARLGAAGRAAGAGSAGGAQFVQDVAPFELMKLRLLNAAHSAMAYLGYLAGHEFIYQASADPLFAAMVERLWSEVAPTLSPLPVEVQQYQRELMQRFRNTALPHRTWQIAMDGSQKLPQRILHAVRDCLALRATGQGAVPIDTLALVVAGWMRYVSGTDERGKHIDVRDPLSDELARIASAARGVPAALCQRLLGLDVIFGEDLPRAAVFTGSVQRHLESLFANGVRATLQSHRLQLL